MQGQEQEIPYANMAVPSDANKSAGYSTDVDTLALAKKILSLERQWMQIAQSNQLSERKLNIIINSQMKDNFRQYESMSQLLEKVLTFLSDFHGGVIPLGWLISPNCKYDPMHLSLFVDNLFCYGSEYEIKVSRVATVMGHRERRMRGITRIAQIVRVLQTGKDEIKSLQCKTEEDPLKQLVLACLTTALKFFESLKKHLKKAEVQVNFDERDVGHLVPLTVGHRDKPTDVEAKYIRTVIRSSEFRYVPEHDTSVSAITPLTQAYPSRVIPPIQKSPDFIQKGSIEATGAAAAQAP